MKRRTYAPKKKTTKKPRFTYQQPVVTGTKTITPSKGIGNRVNCNFIYFDQITQNGGVGGAAVNTLFRLNSLFDPVYAVGGHQPGGYDELMAIYETYCVTEVEYKLVFYNNAAPLFVAAQVSDNDSTSGTISTTLENGNTQFSICGQDSPVKILTGTVDIAKLMGVSKAQLLSDDTFWGNSGTNPLDQAILKISTVPCAAGTDGPIIYCGVELKFKAVLMGGRFVSQS